MTLTRPSRYLALALALLCLSGCRKANVGSGGTPAQRELMQAFLAAHDRNDLEAEKALVDWDGVADFDRKFFEHELREGLRHRIVSIDIVNPLNARPGISSGNNLTPEGFLAVQYDGSWSGKRYFYPIGQKNGRYYITLPTGP